MLVKRRKIIKRLVTGVAVLCCLYLGLLLIVLPLLEHILGLGVYRESTGIYRH